MRAPPKPKTDTLPPAHVRLLVKKEIIRTKTPVTYDGKRLNDAVGNLLWYPICLMVTGVILFICGIGTGDDLTFFIGLAAMIAGGYGFFRYVSVWKGDNAEETVAEQLYVELPMRKR